MTTSTLENPIPATLGDPRSRRSYFAHVRHELRTPLNAILGYSELILEELEDAPSAVRERLAPDIVRMRRAGGELLELVNSCFDSSMLEHQGSFAAAQFREKVTHDLKTPLTAAIGYCEMLIDDAEEAGDWIVAELQKIRCAGLKLLSLLDNVVREMELGGAVEPSSMGVARSQVLDPVTPAVPALAVVHQFSHPAAGPAVGRLLVVDDNEMNRDLLSRRLTKQGHSVETAENGAQALHMARTGRFDIILLDVLMPEMNGPDALRLFKADEDLRDIPIIMISALDEMESVVRCIELGAEDYLPKTFDPVLLQARIEACLEKKAFRDREKEYVLQIEASKRRADELLRVILPEPVVRELEATNTVLPRLYQDVAVLFCDVVGFTPYCATRDPEEVVSNLQELICRYEEIASEHGVQKLKTVGDSFMCAAGLLSPAPDACGDCVRCGLAMVEAARRMDSGWRVRVGIHFGPVVAGVVGMRQFVFDVWGDTVNTAARVESEGLNDAVNVSQEVWTRVAGRFEAVPLGPVALKGKGNMEVYRVLRALVGGSGG